MSWQYYTDKPSDQIVNSKSFESKIKITGNTLDNDNNKNVEMSVVLKYFNNFWKTLEILLINCEINPILNWNENCVISSSAGVETFAITDAKAYVPVATLSSEHNVKLLKQLESGFKRIIIWNKHQSKLTDQEQNRYFDYLIDQSFQVVIRLFVLLFENRTYRTAHRILFSKIRNKRLSCYY